LVREPHPVENVAEVLTRAGAPGERGASGGQIAVGCLRIGSFGVFAPVAHAVHVRSPRDLDGGCARELEQVGERDVDVLRRCWRDELERDLQPFVGVSPDLILESDRAVGAAAVGEGRDVLLWWW